MARFPWKAVAAGATVLGAIGAVLAVRRREPLPKRVALIGDSYAVGLGPELDKLLPDFKFEGHVGTTTTQWAAHSSTCGQCGDWLTAFKPEAVLVSLGTNDTPPNSRSGQTIVRALHGIGAKVVWIEPPKAASSLLSMITSLGVSVIHPPTMPMAPDGLHPTADGYVVWAREIARAVTG